MRFFIGLFCFLFLVCCYAQELSYTATEEICTDEINYEVIHSFRVPAWNYDELSFEYTTEYRINGCKKSEFSYATETTSFAISEENCKELLDAVKKMDLKKLPGKTPDVGGSTGYLEIGKKNYDIKLPFNHKAVQALHNLLMDFLKKKAPNLNRKFSRRTIQGDFEKTVESSVENLLRNPGVYDGKRVRVKGYYKGGFENSSFSSTSDKADDYRVSVSLGFISSYVGPECVNYKNNSYISVEGTFKAGPGGHLWPGEIQRVTKVWTLLKH
jgi:hypothetical protein